MTITSVKNGIVRKIIWYAEEKDSGKGLIQYVQATKSLHEKSLEFKTLLTDLTLSEEEIVSNFSKSCKYKINRAVREGVTVSIYVNEQITMEEIEAFAHFYEEFYKSKGYDQVDISKLITELKTYRDNGALAIAKGIVKNCVVVYHTHLITENYARLLHSASLYRTTDEIPSTVIGMANRYLHKKEMLHFKSMSIRQYDWGGAGTSEEVKHITEFKESFGGKPALFYHSSEAVGIKAKIYQMLISFLT